MNSAIPTGILSKLQLLFRKIVAARRFVTAILCIGFALRLAWVMWWPNEQFIGDYIWLNDRAKDLAAGRGYVQSTGEPTAFWPIGYPLSLSFLYRLFGPHDLAGKLANVVYSTLTLLAVYGLGRRLFSETTARVALLLMAFSPNLIAYNSLLATESIFTLLFTTALWVIFADSSKRFTGLWLGGILGVACNVKPVTLGLFPILFLCLWAVRRKWKPAALQTALAGAVTVLLLVPWLVRNHAVFGRWVFTNEAGLVLLVGNNPDATGQYHRAPIIAEIYPKLQQGGQEEYKWNREAMRLALEFIRDNPGRFLQLGLKKLRHMYKHDVDGIWHTLNGVTPKVSRLIWNTFTRIGHLYYAGLMLLVAAYLARSLLQQELLTLPNLCWLFVVYFSFVCFLFHGLPRYHVPLLPIFCLFAARFVDTMVRCATEAPSPAVDTIRQDGSTRVT